jgi:hypothetical protein
LADEWWNTLPYPDAFRMHTYEYYSIVRNPYIGVETYIYPKKSKTWYHW